MRRSAPDGSSRRDVVLGVDVGGTKVRAALAGLDGDILAEMVETTRGRTATAFVDQIVRMLDRLMATVGADVPRRPDAGDRHRDGERSRAAARVVRAGMAVPVTIDPRTGIVGSEQNVPGLGGLDLRAALEGALGIPAALDNDANLAALAEGRHGAAVGHRDFVVVAIGTGIGMGIVADGRLVRGARGRAGEIGFLPIGTDPARPASRRAGAFERSAAGPALRRRIDAAARGGRPTALRAGSGLAEVIDLADADPVARGVLDREVRILATGVAAVVALIDPDLVLLAGGVGSVAGLAERVGAALAALVAEPPPVRVARLAERGPLVGAIDLAIDEVRAARRARSLA